MVNGILSLNDTEYYCNTSVMGHRRRLDVSPTNLWIHVEGGKLHVFKGQFTLPVLSELVRDS